MQVPSAETQGNGRSATLKNDSMPITQERKTWLRLGSSPLHRPRLGVQDRTWRAHARDGPAANSKTQGGAVCMYLIVGRMSSWTNPDLFSLGKETGKRKTRAGDVPASEASSHSHLVAGEPRSIWCKNRTLQSFQKRHLCGGQKVKSPMMVIIDHSRARTCNLLIRSQTPCHWAMRPLLKSASPSSIISRKQCERFPV